MHADIQEVTESRAFRSMVAIIGIAVLILLIFQAGMFVGYRKAAFAYGQGDNYYRAFGSRGMQRGGMPMMHDDFIGAHGAVGRIVSIDLPTFVVSDPDGAEKVVTVSDDTSVRHFNEVISVNDLKVDDFVIVLGAPDDQSQVHAKLIRLLPPPPSEQISTSTITHQR